LTEAQSYETKDRPAAGEKKPAMRTGDEKPVDQYFANVMMKVNLKLGDVNHSTASVQTQSSSALT
jgi:hypothetical protein